MTPEHVKQRVDLKTAKTLSLPKLCTTLPAIHRFDMAVVLMQEEENQNDDHQIWTY